MSADPDTVRPQRRRAEQASLLLEDAARVRGCIVERLDAAVAVVSHRGRRVLFAGLQGPSASVSAKYLCDQKMRGRERLARAGLSTPLARDFATGEHRAAWRFASVLIAPVVVKPLSQDDGRGVTTGVVDEGAFAAAWEEASRWQRRRHPRRVIVEEQVEGTDLRCFVIGDRMVAMIERRPANPGQPGPDAAEPTAEERVDVTDDAHPGYAAVAVAALAAIPGLRYGAVDLIASSVTEAPAQGNHVVAEVEFAPGPAAHVPTVGEPRDVAGAILDLELDG